MSNTCSKKTLTDTIVHCGTTLSFIIGITFIATPARGDGLAKSKRVYQNPSTTMTARKFDFTLPDVEGDRGYNWLKVQRSGLGAPGPFDVPIPNVKMRGGEIEDFMKTTDPALLVLPEGKLIVETSSKVKDDPLPPGKVDFKKLDGTLIGTDKEGEKLKASLKKVGAHNSTTDGLGGSSEFAMVLANLGTIPVSVTDFQLFQNIEMIPFILASEASPPPDDFYTDPINSIGSGERVGNIMSNFTLNPDAELAFHFDANFDPNLIAISSGFCNGDFECSDSAMARVPEPTCTLSFLALGTLASTTSILKRKLKLFK